MAQSARPFDPIHDLIIKPRTPDEQAEGRYERIGQWWRSEAARMHREHAGCWVAIRDAEDFEIIESEAELHQRAVALSRDTVIYLPGPDYLLQPPYPAWPIDTFPLVVRT